MTFAKAAMLALGLAGAVDAHAQRRDRAPRQFGEDTPIVLQPDKAYIFYRTPARTTFRFVREVDDAERATHTAARTEAFTPRPDPGRAAAGGVGTRTGALRPGRHPLSVPRSPAGSADAGELPLRRGGIG